MAVTVTENLVRWSAEAHERAAREFKAVGKVYGRLDPSGKVGQDESALFKTMAGEHERIAARLRDFLNDAESEEAGNE